MQFNQDTTKPEHNTKTNSELLHVAALCNLRTSSDIELFTISKCRIAPLEARRNYRSEDHKCILDKIDVENPL